MPLAKPLLLATAIVLAAVVACSPVPRIIAAPGPASIQRFRIGKLDAFALIDGEIDIANDGKTLGINRATAEVGDLLTSAGLPRENSKLSIQPLLVKAGPHVLLFDTGAADAPWARAGRLPSSLALAGVAPGEVTDIFVSHGHPDHVGGLLSATGALAFPNAAIHISSLEWVSMEAAADQRRLTDAIAPRVATFEPGARILPQVTAVATPGHTPGHSSYEIASQGERLLYLGDVAHHSIVSVQRPAWTIAFDGDARAAEAMRQEVLASLARDGERVYAVHFPFPGLGHVRARGNGFVWEPE